MERPSLSCCSRHRTPPPFWTTRLSIRIITVHEALMLCLRYNPMGALALWILVKTSQRTLLMGIRPWRGHSHQFSSFFLLLHPGSSLGLSCRGILNNYWDTRCAIPRSLHLTNCDNIRTPRRYPNLQSHRFGGLRLLRIRSLVWHIGWGCRGSSVSKWLGYGLDDRIFFFFFRRRIQTGSGVHGASNPVGTRSSFAGLQVGRSGF
jgi:hypothetical protein